MTCQDQFDAAKAPFGNMASMIQGDRDTLNGIGATGTPVSIPAIVAIIGGASGRKNQAVLAAGSAMQASVCFAMQMNPAGVAASAKCNQLFQEATAVANGLDKALGHLQAALTLSILGTGPAVGGEIASTVAELQNAIDAAKRAREVSL